MNKQNIRINLFSGGQLSWALLSLLALGCLWLMPGRLAAAQAVKNDGSLSLGKLIVKVTGFKNDKGELRAVLYDNQPAFDEDRRFKQTTAIISDRTATALFLDVKPGAYGIAVFHDTNKNGELDENWLGIPKENYGLSNNVRASLSAGIPTFDQFKIDYTGVVTTVEIKLQK